MRTLRLVVLVFQDATRLACDHLAVLMFLALLLGLLLLVVVQLVEALT